MKVVFIAGAFTGDGSQESKRKNTSLAKKFAIELANKGVGFYSPHLNVNQLSLHEAATFDDSFLRAVNKQFFGHCDALLLIPGWEESGGAREEKAIAEKRGLPVFEPGFSTDITEIITWAHD